MKSTSSLWQVPNIDATNESGWSGLPGGYFSGGGNFDNLGVGGSWWSASELDAGSAWFRLLSYCDGVVGRYDFDKEDGLSVRCVRD